MGRRRGRAGALGAGKTELDELAVVDAFADGETAVRAYLRLHREVPERELYVLHSDRGRAGDHGAHVAGATHRGMKIRLDRGLAYVEATLSFRGRSLRVEDVIPLLEAEVAAALRRVAAELDLERFLADDLRRPGLPTGHRGGVKVVA